MPPRMRGRGRGRGDSREMAVEPVVASNAPPNQDEEEVERPRARRRLDEIDRMAEVLERERVMGEQIAEMRREIQDLRREREAPPPPVVQRDAPAPAPAPVPAPPAAVIQRDVPPPRQGARRQIDDGGVTMDNFLRYGLPEFRGRRGDDPTDFLQDVGKIVRRLPCSDARVVELVGLLLKEHAWRWYEQRVERELYSDAPPTWERFRQMMIDEFLTSGERLRRALRFEQLRQGSRSVAEYADEFSQLSVFAADIAPTEQARIERFRRGLVTSLYNTLGAVEFPSLTALIDRAQQVEARQGDDRRRAQARGQGGQSRRTEGGPQSRDRQDRGLQDTQRPSQQSSSVPICQHCQRRHKGVCWLFTGACLRCGQQGHYLRDCPRPPRPSESQPTVQQSGQGSVRGRGRGRGQSQSTEPAPAGRGQARVFSVTPQEAQASHAAVTGIIFIYHQPAYALFDSGATHSFISPMCVRRLGRTGRLMTVPLGVCTPLGETVEVTDRHEACEIEIGG